MTFTTLMRTLAIALIALLAGAAGAAARPTPTLDTGPATAISQTTATLNGFVNPRGYRTDYWFEVGPTRSYGFHTPKGRLPAGSTTKPIAIGLYSLVPGTLYHYRLVAQSGNVVHGVDRTFRTAAIPTTSTINVAPNPVVAGAVLQVFGSLVGPPDIGGKQVALQANPFPYTQGFRQIGNTVLTDAHGGYVFTLAPPALPLTTTSQLRVVDQSKPSVVSSTIIEGVAASVTLRAHRGRGGRRHAPVVVFSGRVSPTHNGIVILIQKKLRGGGWRTVGTGRTGPPRSGFGSVFVRRLRLSKLGRFRALTQIPTGDNVDGTSNSVVVR